MQTFLATNAALVAKLNAAPTANNTTSPSNMAPSVRTSGGRRTPFDKAARIANLNPNGYFWTHSYRVSTGHDGYNFKRKLLGHVDAATRTDIMGGSTKGKPN